MLVNYGNHGKSWQIPCIHPCILLQGELLNGIRMGFPVVDVKASLKDGGFHPVDSSAIAFEIAARAAFKEGAGKAKPIVMEPIMKAGDGRGWPGMGLGGEREMGYDGLISLLCGFW